MKMSRMKKFIIADVLIFVFLSIYSTYTAALVDAGSWTNPDPINEAGHYMTMKEAIIYNIPLGISVGIAVAGAIMFFGLLGSYIYKTVKSYRQTE